MSDEVRHILDRTFVARVPRLSTDESGPGEELYFISERDLETLAAINTRYKAMNDQQLDKAITALDRVARLKGDEVQCFHEAHRIAKAALSEITIQQCKG